MTGAIRILQVGDTADAEALRDADDRFEVVTATGKEATLSHLSTGAVDGIVSAYELSDGDGIALLETVRTDHPALPFVLVPEAGSEGLASRAIAAGVTEYVPAADGPRAVAERVIAAVDRYREHRARDAVRTDTQRERDRFWAIFETIPYPVAHVRLRDGENVVEHVNPAFETVFGYDAEALHGRSLNDTIVPDELLPEARQIDASVREGVTEQVVERKTPDGRREFLFRARQLVSGDDGQREALGVYVDVTERQGRERELSAIQDRMEFALATTNSVIFEVNVDSAVERRHGPFERLFGVPDDLVRTSQAFYERAVHPDDRARVESRQTAVIEGGIDAIEIEFRTHPDAGAPRWIRSRMARVDVEDSEDAERVIGLATDISGLKERERELKRQNERLEAFASVVSHDLRNPLNVAQGRLEMAREDCESEHHQRVADALDRSQALIDDLLTLAREGQRVSELAPVSLADAVSRCTRTVETGGATLVTETDATIEADLGQLQQVLENLIRNAIDHGGDAVTITVGDLEDGFYVEDDGPGVPEDRREDVFEAGFSTSTEGTGFGLAIVREIVEDHGWEIAVSESQSGGARFEITGVEIDS